MRLLRDVADALADAAIDSLESARGLAGTFVDTVGRERQALSRKIVALVQRQPPREKADFNPAGLEA